MSKPYFYKYQNQDDIEQRIKHYNLKSIVKKTDDILDIGSAEGLFCINLAPYVKSVTGVDPITIHNTKAKEIAKLKNISNCNFIQNDFVTFCEKTTQQFDLVTCFAVHSYIIGTHKRCHWEPEEMDMTTFEGFANYMIGLIKSGGLMMIEGHPTFDQDHQDWEPLMSILKPRLTIVDERMGRPNRNLILFRNEI